MISAVLHLCCWKFFPTSGWDSSCFCHQCGLYPFSAETQHPLVPTWVTVHRVPTQCNPREGRCHGAHTIYIDFSRVTPLCVSPYADCDFQPRLYLIETEVHSCLLISASSVGSGKISPPKQRSLLSYLSWNSLHAQCTFCYPGKRPYPKAGPFVSIPGGTMPLDVSSCLLTKPLPLF